MILSHPVRSRLTPSTFSLVLITFSPLSRLCVYYLGWALQLLWPDFAGYRLPLTKLPLFSFAQCQSFKFKYKLYCITFLLKGNQGFPLCQDEIQIPNLQPLPHSSLTIPNFMPSFPRTEALVDEFSILSRSLSRLGTVSIIPLYVARSFRETQVLTPSRNIPWFSALPSEADTFLLSNFTPSQLSDNIHQLLAVDCLSPSLDKVS